MEKQKILSLAVYDSIVSFINKFQGLPIDCEIALTNKFKDINEFTLASILSSECNYKTRIMYHKSARKIPLKLKAFEEIQKQKNDDRVLLRMAVELGLPPTNFSRLMLHEKYKKLQKAEIVRMLKNPHLIPDQRLAANVRMCAMSDNQEGPITDIVRRCIGEEHEIKLRTYATQAGMVYCDERDLRRTGFDKTPDLKLALPFLYKGSIINWIESKAVFGDGRSHKKYLREQLLSYYNRFGAGIVIYWFGYLEDILRYNENFDGLIIMDKFPDMPDMEFLKV